MNKKILKLIFIFGIIFSGAVFGGTDASAMDGYIAIYAPISREYAYITDSVTSYTWYDENNHTAVYQTTGENSGTLTLNSFHSKSSIDVNFDNAETFELEIILNGDNSSDGSLYFNNSNINVTFSGDGSFVVPQIMDSKKLTFLSGSYTVVDVYAYNEINVVDGTYNVKVFEGPADINITGGTFPYIGIISSSGDVLIKDVVFIFTESFTNPGVRGKNITIENSTLNFAKFQTNIDVTNNGTDIIIKNSTISNAVLLGGTFVVIEDSTMYYTDFCGLENVTISNSHFDYFSTYMTNATIDHSDFTNVHILTLYDENVVNNSTFVFSPDDNEHRYYSNGANIFDDAEFNNSTITILSAGGGLGIKVRERLFLNNSSLEMGGLDFGVTDTWGGDSDYIPITFYGSDINIHDIIGPAIGNERGGVFIERGTNIDIKNVKEGINAYDLYVEGGLTKIDSTENGIIPGGSNIGIFSITGGEVDITNSRSMAFGVPYGYDKNDDYEKGNFWISFTLGPDMLYEVSDSAENYKISQYYMLKWDDIELGGYSYLPETITPNPNNDQTAYIAKNIRFYSTHEENGGEDMTIRAVIPATISLELSSNNIDFTIESPVLVTDSITVTADTNSEEGYSVSFKTDDETNSLVSANTENTATIPSISETYSAASFPANGWGYSIDNGANFGSIPISSYNIYTTNTNGKNTYDFGIGIRADFRSVVSDAYSNDLIFTAVVNL